MYWGVFAGAVLVCLFDWIWNRNWYGAVSYSDYFIPAWTARGERQPVALPLVYCFFFGLPMIQLLEHRSVLDERFGRLQWPLIFGLFAIPQMPFEIFASRVLKLWHYHEVPPWTYLGVPWSNAVFAGFLGIGFYAAGRLALRWTWSPADREGLTATGPSSIDSRLERWIVAFVTTLALSSLVLTTITYAFLPWYMVVKPWAPTAPAL
ncbi:hypothetical protein [Nocardia sp. NPDC057668]|uniref:hypothetical protein n=1 Tax=Nocardia sp. NPDC057668 TaxID=3346202 RepID=UPI00366F8344